MTAVTGPVGTRRTSAHPPGSERGAVISLDQHDASTEALVGAYALDAVDQADAVRVRAHLAGCDRCRRAVGAYREVAALLGDAPRAAPAELWLRIAAGLTDRGPPSP